MNNFCSLPDKITTPESLAVISIIFCVAIFSLIFWHLKKRQLRVILIFASIPLFLAALFFIFIGYVFYEESYYGLTSGQYHVLNAAIKNTCTASYIDSAMNHCPKNINDLISIEPEHFSSITRNSKLTYYYYPETNQYTLVVRDTPYTAVIFDPRLHDINNYGLDFIDVNLTHDCSENYQIDPPQVDPSYSDDKVRGETIREYNSQYGNSIKIN